ncbi:MAG: HAMP domain-containing histidine kinase [Candidatus Eremiobacteraeota bacterium]|nr:HAMP domain-containing histidine kinase [Candidatus Eremiobacteraeota bacterium]
MKRLYALPIVCYLLLIAAFIVDLLTPQLFVAAILLNGPIALSGLALSGRLTTSLVIFAEIANLVAGYVNGVQAGHHWDSIALGNRLLLAAAFVLVGYLTTIVQDYAREAGRSQERSRAASRELRLRRALESVRETLNVELVLRAIAREAATLLEARDTLLIRRGGTLQEAQCYISHASIGAVQVERRALDTTLSTIFSRIDTDSGVVRLESSDPVAAMILEPRSAQSALASRLKVPNEEAVLFAFFEISVDRETERLMHAFSEGADVALAQASLFVQLGARNDEIAAHRDEIESRNRVIRDIVYALAHDLRTPLKAQDLTMRQALEGSYGQLPDRYVEILKTTIASNTDVRRLVDTLLMVARFEAGETSRLRERLDLADEARRIVDELRPVADIKNVSLVFDGEGSVSSSGDPTEVRRAIANLIANAIEATPSEGAISVRAFRDGASSVIEVEDSGYGVPPEQRDKLFERFMPGERRAGAGTGLVLYIVRLIADKMGGTASYRPRDPRGSIFRVSLPGEGVVQRAVG